MTPSPEFTIERRSAEISADEYIGRYRDAERFEALCRQCPNYCRRWGCPPFDSDPLSVFGKYDTVKIIGVKVTPLDKQLPLDSVYDLMNPVTGDLNRQLIEMERTLGGRCYGFAGKCHFCGDTPCARIEDKPCRHPEVVRPSLEAVGFNVSKTASELLDLEIRWSEGDVVPEYLTLVGGIFYNKPL